MNVWVWYSNISYELEDLKIFKPIQFGGYPGHMMINILQTCCFRIRSMPFGERKNSDDEVFLAKGKHVMAFKIFSIIFGWATLITGCTGIPEGLESVNGFEPGRYLGKWYEIARLDHTFERNLSNVSATYTREEKGDIRVQNKGFNAKTGVWKQIEGHARSLENEAVGSLKVSFFGPFYGGYHVIALDKETYSYSMVSGPSRSYLWILSRTKTLDDDIYAGLVKIADGWGFDTQKLIKVPQDVPDD